MISSNSQTFFGLRKLPARYGGMVMPFFLSTLMTCIVSMISTLRGVGWSEKFFQVWLSSWGLSWVIGFPVLLLVLPIVRKLTSFVVRAAA